jgi:hypothetical protein
MTSGWINDEGGVVEWARGLLLGWLVEEWKAMRAR